MILALILLLSCCPSVYATAEESSNDSYSLSDMDHKIREILDSQISQEERDALTKLDPSLSDAILLRCSSAWPFSFADKKPGEMMAMCLEWDKKAKLSYYFVFADSVLQAELRESDGKQSLNFPLYNRDFSDNKFVKDIMNLGPQVEINGAPSTITGIYIFNVSGHLVCILTENGALFKYYKNSKSEPRIFSEAEFQKYGLSYDYFMASTGTDEYGHGIVGYFTPFSEFIDNYDECMAEADEMNAKRRLVKIKQALATYGPIALGVVLVAGGGAAIYIICRKRKKKALAAESAPNPEDVPTPTEQVLDPTEPISDPTEQIPNTPDP